MQAIYTLLLALFVSMVLVPPLARIAGPLKLTDQPGERKIHFHAIPRTGGIAIVIGALAPILLWVPLRPDLFAFTSAVGVLFVAGVLDDRFNLDFRLKLLGQLIAALIVILGGDVLIEYIPFFSETPLPSVVSLPLTILVLVGVTNAVNLSDGLDGLAGGLGLLALGGLAVLAYQGDDLPALMVALAMMGATFGFLRFNTHPAQIFMGDTGSQFLGFGVAFLAIVTTQRADSAVSKMVPLLILGLPILDTLTVMVLRIADGRSPFMADRTHLHHRLLNAGLSQPQAVALVYLAQALLVFIAYMMRYSLDAAVVVVYVLFAAAILAGVHTLVRHGGLEQDRPHPIRRLLGLNDAVHRFVRRLLVKTPYAVLNLVLPLILLLGAAMLPISDHDIVLLSGTMLAIFALSLMRSSALQLWIERLTAYVTVVIVVYLASEVPALTTHPALLLAFFSTLGILVGIWVRFSRVKFQISSLDVLILLIAVVVPNLSGDWFAYFGIMALESVILFYSIEVLLTARKNPWNPLRVATLASLSILTVKGILAL